MGIYQAVGEKRGEPNRTQTCAASWPALLVLFLLGNSTLEDSAILPLQILCTLFSNNNLADAIGVHLLPMRKISGLDLVWVRAAGFPESTSGAFLLTNSALCILTPNA
jgi:hypothetical protein